MEKKLTLAQVKELDNALLKQFKRLDAEFHQRAEKPGVAAAAQRSLLDDYQVLNHAFKWFKSNSRRYVLCQLAFSLRLI